MTTIANHQTGPLPQVVEQALIQGDLSKLNPENRVKLYKETCESLGLNPLTKPFDYINLNGKLTLYARKDATEQLRKVHGVSIEKLEHTTVEGVHIVTAYAKDKTGRSDTSTGAVPLGTAKGEAMANAIMKAETKAKRRVTLSICGLGILDETEVGSVPDARPEPIQLDPQAQVAEAFEAVTVGELPPSKSHDEAMERMRANPFPQEGKAVEEIPFAPEKPDVTPVVELKPVLTDDEIIDEFKYKLSACASKADALHEYKELSAYLDGKNPVLLAKAFGIMKAGGFK